ncbi:MAG: hypothetical protein MO846_06875 [Candidatus Devosia symbiotica]|nr:hypothetical protein [Candidatus Devosia symbiotica]
MLDFSHQYAIERNKGLVKQKQPRIDRERPRQSNASLYAARKLMRKQCASFTQSNPLQRHLGSGSDDRRIGGHDVTKGI